MSEPAIDPTALPVPGAAVPDRAASAPTALARARDRVARWWPRLVFVGAVALVAAGQLAEDSLDSPPLQLLSPELSVRRWTLIIAVLYLVAMGRFVDRLVDRSRARLDRVFVERPAGFERYVTDLQSLSPRLELGLLLASAAVVVGIFGGLGSSLPTDDPVTGAPVLLPSLSLATVLIVVEYTIVGWSLVSLVTATVRRAWAIGRLSRERLAIDVFNTTNLIALGNIALGTALAPAGVIVVLLVGYGRPSQPLSWAVLALAMLASLMALILPLRGIHAQMARAKQGAQTTLSAQLRTVYDEMERGSAVSAADSARLNSQSGTLVALRKSVDEMTTWPFRDTLAFSRALLIASAPIIYTIVTELIKIFWLNPLTP